MKLNELYEIQGGLKRHIGYTGEDKFSKMMLAMMVEFMECCNDWRGFKYWSVDPRPKPSLLEEYVDGLHFVLEAGLDLLEMDCLLVLPKEMFAEETEGDATNQFKRILTIALALDHEAAYGVSYLDDMYEELFERYLALGVLLGFTDEQIVNAYMEKNKENHERQNNGY